MKQSDHFISCDWGTSTFRLSVVDKDTLAVLVEHKTSEGIKSLHEKFKTQVKRSQKEYFQSYLFQEILKLPTVYQDDPIVISGMASSNLGIMELAYADFPLIMDGRNIKYEVLELSEEKAVMLISGARDDSGVIRGEEVQAIGLADELSAYEKGILILPGTHSKHLSFENGAFVKIQTYMTGELFELLKGNSILANSIKVEPWDEIFLEDFLEGVRIGASGNLTAQLFSVRVNVLFAKKRPEANFFYLNGMLIGDELRSLRNTIDQIFLASSDPLNSMYNSALRHFKKTVINFDAESLKEATFKGQMKVLGYFLNR